MPKKAQIGISPFDKDSCQICGRPGGLMIVITAEGNFTAIRCDKHGPQPSEVE